MTTNAEYLDQAETALLTALAAGAGKPNYTINGQSVSWGELWDRLAKVQAAKAAINGPFEIESLGQT